MAAISGSVGAVYNNYSGTDKSKLLADFQDDETWTAGAGATAADDGTNYRLGTESIKLSDDNDTSGDITLTQNSITLNIDQFQSGAASDSSDYIYFIFFINGVSYISNVSIRFSPDATYDGSDYYSYGITSLVEGWNYVKIKKSAFTSAGSPNWAATQSIHLIETTTNNANANGAYVSFQAIYLIDDSYDLVLSNNTAYVMEAVTLFYNWSADISADLADATTFDSSGWGQNVMTTKKFEISSEKYFVDESYLTDLIAASTKVLLLYLSTSSGYRYEGRANIASDAIDVSVDDLISESLSFSGEGELYYTALQIIDS